MELNLKTLEYQLQAVNAMANLFVGQPNAATEFSIKAQNDMRFVPNLGLQISDEQLQQNLANLQNRQNRPHLLVEQGKNFTVEMETALGNLRSFTHDFLN